ncbi:hypothetical protein [Acanthopleuribacter pedis]|uniref:Lipoprotein n=1 Tax=Acanthopleuribacter pedis TaxID=442870 RepID=A0A8J7QFI5_9BACT|nr:hypothetical protein [Acanthopleuribacter pedis]MBO1319631.1 hypothetical protein [Acanthopleuribacter pedis]
MRTLFLALAACVSLGCAVKQKTVQQQPAPVPVTTVLAGPVINTAPTLAEHELQQLAEWQTYQRWSRYAGEIAELGEKQRKIAYLDAQAALKIDESLEHRLQFLVLASFQTRLRQWSFIEQQLKQVQADPCLPPALTPWLSVLAARLQLNRGNHRERVRLQRNIRDLRQIQESLRQKIEALSQIEAEMGRPETTTTQEQQP